MKDLIYGDRQLGTQVKILNYSDVPELTAIEIAITILKKKAKELRGQDNQH